MRRPVWSRVLALFVGLWFVAESAGPEITHACPTHGSHAVAHHDHAVAAAGHHSGPAPHRGTQCTCLGQCCSAGPVALITPRASLADAVTAATRDAGLPDSAYVPVAVRHVLPLAHAPPRSA